MVKIVHCSDTHFDSIFAGLPHQIAEARREEQFLTFEKVIQMTKSFGADVLLLPGDIFENEYVTYKTAQFLQRCFEKVKDTHVFIAPGNHDHIAGNEIYDNIDLGANVTVFDQKVQSIILEDKKCRVYGYGFRNAHQSEDFPNDFSAEDDEYVNLFVLHCGLPPYSDDYGVSTKQIAAFNVDYLAAGHIHAFEGIKKSGKTYFAYSGIHEGRNFGELGEKGIIMGEISKGVVNLEFVPVAKRRFWREEIDVSNCLTNEDVCNKFIGNAEGLYHITLIGQVRRDVYFNTDVLAKRLMEKVYYAKVSDNTQEDSTRDLGIMENLFLEMLQEKDVHPSVRERAARLGLDALAGRKVGLR